jgi:anti-sigma regulatory factor (Ser/Thr protein kinase)/serine/threonine protein phosphatase PrpC
VKVLSRSGLPIEKDEDLFRARRMARGFAQRAGMSDAAEIRLATIVSELGRNILKYAGRGHCEFSFHNDENQPRVRCVVRDHGPGIADTRSALADGYSTGGTLGVGLPGVRRLADRFEIDTSDQGTAILVEVHITQRPGSKTNPTWSSGGTTNARSRIKDTARVGIAIQPYRMGRASGDQAGAWRRGQLELICLVDGLGHGADAEEAAKLAVRCAGEDIERDLASILRRCDRALRGGRGAAVTLVRIDRATMTVEYIAVGNVRCAHIGDQARLLAGSYGIIGENASIPTARRLDVSPTDMILLWTDGLPETLNLVPHRLRTEDHAGALAERLIREHAKPDDDAGVVVYRVEGMKSGRAASTKEVAAP